MLALLCGPSGATIATVTRSTGWQPHTVRAFLAAVVRKKVGLRLESEKTDGERVYRMPRYYFHIEDHRTYIDHVGVELPDLTAARDEAVGAAGQILRDGAAKNLWSGKPWRMWVTQSPFANERQRLIFVGTLDRNVEAPGVQ